MLLTELEREIKSAFTDLENAITRLKKKVGDDKNLVDSIVCRRAYRLQGQHEDKSPRWL
jgi:hypothetical protein